MEKPYLIHYEQEILEQLEKAGPKGLTKHKLGVKGSKSAKGLALTALEKESKIGNLGTHRKNRYVLTKHYKPLEMAYELIDHNAKAAGILRSGALFLLIRKDLANFLLEENRKGRVVLSRGEWSGASEAIRSGAIKINGQPHLLVEFKE